MRQPISWSALADARVGVWGLGVEGRASIRRLASMGVTPVLVDDAPAAPTIDGRSSWPPSRAGLRALLACDVVVKSPGISRYRPDVGQLEAAGVTVCGGLGLFMAEADPARVACITGTKGKSTTTAIAVHLLAALGYDARAGGNIGHPPWDTDEADDPTTGSSRPRASRCPTWPSARTSSPSPPCRPTTSTGTARSSATTPTSWRSPRCPA